jgi:hypothetical protein
MKFEIIATALLLASCGNLLKEKPADQGSNTAAYAYGQCGENRIFAIYRTNDTACVYIRSAESCHSGVAGPVLLNSYEIPTDALQRALNQSVGPNAFIDLENEDVMATVGVDTIRRIKSAVKSVEQEVVKNNDEQVKRRVWEYCTDNGRNPYSSAVQECINHWTQRSRDQMRHCY